MASQDFQIKLDTSKFDAAARDYIKGLTRLPRTASRNPQVAAMRDYQIKLLPKLWMRRPTVGQSGSWMGVKWPSLKPQYTRKTDGVTVPVWGGVPRAVLRNRFGGGFVRLGVVNRAGPNSIRQARTLTGTEKAAGFGAVRTGQRFSGKNVKGKLRDDGTRYKRGDKQLYKAKGDGLLQDFTQPPEISGDGLTVTATSSKPYAKRIADTRPFHFTRRIGVLVAADLEKRWKDHILRVWEGRA